MNITIKQLRVFVVVYDVRSFTLAGVALHMTQSAVSKICRELEEQVDCQLFDRTSRMLVPQEGAHVLYRSAQEILSSVNVAERRLESLKSLDHGALNITASTLIMYGLVSATVAQFHRAHPGIHLELIELPTADGIEHVLNGAADIGVVSLSKPNAKISSEVIYESPMWVTCAPDHALAGLDAVSVEEVDRYLHIGLRKVYGFSQGLGAVFHCVGIAPRFIPVNSGTLLSSLALARDGLGIAVVPGYIRNLALALGLAVVRVDSDVVLHRLSLIYRQSAWLSPAAKDFVAALKRNVCSG